MSTAPYSDIKAPQHHEHVTLLMTQVPASSGVRETQRRPDAMKLGGEFQHVHSFTNTERAERAASTALSRDASASCGQLVSNNRRVTICRYL